MIDRTGWMHEGKRVEWKNTYRRLFYKLIHKKYLSDCESFLDVACGRGLFLDCMPKSAKRIGVDLQVPKDHFDFEAHNTDYKAWSLPCDCVFASQFIEHVDGQELAKWCCERARKKVVIITGRATRDFWDDPTHTRPYTKKAVRCLLEEQGFSVILNVNLWPTHSHITVATKNGN